MEVMRCWYVLCYSHGPLSEAQHLFAQVLLNQMYATKYPVIALGLFH